MAGVTSANLPVALWLSILSESMRLYTFRQHPKVFLNNTVCSFVGYTLYLIALFAMFFTLRRYVSFNNISCHSACCDNTVWPAPKRIFPKIVSYVWKSSFYDPAAGRFVGINKSWKVRIWFAGKKNMNVIYIMIPCFNPYSISGRDIYERQTPVWFG